MSTTSYLSAVKVIGFDLDQTLYPKSPKIDQAIQGYLYNKIAEARGCSRKEAERLFKSLYQEGRGLSGSQTMTELSIPNGGDVVQEALEQADIARYLRPNPTTIKLLADLKARYSNFDLLTGSGRSLGFKKLTKLGIDLGIFTHIISADEASKGRGEAFQLWLSYYPSLDSNDFLYIGDRAKTDCVVPCSLGLRAVLVNIKKPDPQIACLQLPDLQALATYLLPQTPTTF